jgi:polysaccharide deacetylase 2 family uncharacterized protein YibQ
VAPHRPPLLICRSSPRTFPQWSRLLDAPFPPRRRRPIPAAALFVAAITAVLFVVAGRATAPPFGDSEPASWHVDRALEDALSNPAPAARPAPPRAPDPGAVSAGFGLERAAERPFVPRADPPPPPPSGPCIALVFDDLGYTTSGLVAEMLELPPEVTFAVLPGLPASAEFARAAAARGHEILLHLPMEPVDIRHHDPGHDALFAELDPEENLRRLRRQLDGLAGYVGVSNHMGSRFTSRSDLMTPVLREIRRRGDGLFFLDSSTTPASMVGTAARTTGLPYVENNLFLDGGDESSGPPAVRTERVAALALRSGHAVAIGHVKRETVDAVRVAIGRWQDEGIRLVRLSELVQR